MTGTIVRPGDAFLEQARHAADANASFMAALMEAAAGHAGDGVLAELFAGAADPSATAMLPLRWAAALHALVLSDRAPELARCYPPHASGFDAQRAWPLVEEAQRRHREHFRDWLAVPPQTNEVGRSAVLLGGFLVVAERVGMPLALCEIGASAGLNLVWDRFGYALGTARWGSADAPVQLCPRWEGELPPLRAPLVVASRAACDLHPVDLEDAEARLRLRAYVWAGQADRAQRLERAIAVARAEAVRVERADAACWLESILRDPVAGRCRVVYHSVMWIYLPAATRARIEALVLAAAARATRAAPLAWLRFEGVARDEPPALLLDTWPGHGREELARAHWHGEWVRWTRPPSPSGRV